MLESCIGVPFIVQLLDVFTKREKGCYIYLVTELCGYDMVAYMTQHGELAPAEIRCVVRTLFHGLLYLHDVLQMAHADVKPANVLVDTSGDAKASVVACKLGDLGRAAHVNSQHSPSSKLASK